MNTLKFMGLPMCARSLFTPHPTARPTRLPIRNEKKNIPDAVPQGKFMTTRNLQASAKELRVVPS